MKFDSLSITAVRWLPPSSEGASTSYTSWCSPSSSWLHKSSTSSSTSLKLSGPQPVSCRSLLVHMLHDASIFQSCCTSRHPNNSIIGSVRCRHTSCCIVHNSGVVNNVQHASHILKTTSSNAPCISHVLAWVASLGAYV